MDKDYFMNAGIPPLQLHFDAIPWSGLNCTAAEQPFMDTNSAVDQFSHFESALSSMVTSPASAAPSNEAFLFRELIGKLNGAGSSAAYAAAATNNNDSCYSTPISSPILHLPILDQINLSPNLGNSGALTPPLPSLSADPGFAERAAKFSCFGSRSFNGRTAPLSLNISESPHRSKSPLMNAKLPRVSSSPSLKQQAGSSPENKNFTEIRPSEKKLSKFSGSAANSNEESSVSDQIPSGETGSGSKISNELNSRKRKAVSKSKSKENGSAKGVEGDNDGNAKRSKLTGNGKIENDVNKSDEEAKGGGSNDESEKQKANQKPPEPPKDYIHVRARRGQATDSHSLAERVRREKISERMKLLQDLVPGCNKVTGKALMLDEIINYVQSLQRQVEFLSMKLASVNPELDFNMDNLHSKDTFQQNATIPQQLYPMDSSAPFYQQNVQPPMHNNTDVSGSLPLGIQLSSVDGFAENFPQFPGFTEDDLHSIVGFVHNPVNFPGPNQTSNMKVER